MKKKNRQITFVLAIIGITLFAGYATLAVTVPSAVGLDTKTCNETPLDGKCMCLPGTEKGYLQQPIGRWSCFPEIIPPASGVSLPITTWQDAIAFAKQKIPTAFCGVLDDSYYFNPVVGQLPRNADGTYGVIPQPQAYPGERFLFAECQKRWTVEDAEANRVACLERDSQGKCIRVPDGGTRKFIVNFDPMNGRVSYLRCNGNYIQNCPQNIGVCTPNVENCVEARPV